MIAAAEDNWEELFEVLAIASRRRLPILRPAPVDCQSCGACCSHYKLIDLYSDDPNFRYLVDLGLVEAIEGGGFSMKMDANRRCIALTGNVGEQTSCSVYDHRPESCRSFERGSDRCRNRVIVDIWRKHDH